MRKTILVGLCVAGLLAAVAFPRLSSMLRHAEIQDKLPAAMGDEQAMRELLPLLDKEIAARPDDLLLLQNRLTILSTLGMYEEALKDAETFVRLVPRPDALFVKCTLEEQMGLPRETYTACYNQVFEQSAGKDEAEFLHVYAALMAERPEAEELRAAYLRRYRDVEEMDIYRHILQEFDRKTALGTRAR